MRFKLGLVFLLGIQLVRSAHAQSLVYEGIDGPGVGTHIVFLAGDHEYRSEETLPALARILARHHGFQCTVLFTTDPETGEILPGSSHMPGTDVLDSADLLVIFLRFQDFSAEQMQPIVDYLDRAGPVIGLRTSTHAFKIPEGSSFVRFDYRFAGEEMTGGFGRQVLGETWVSHYGKNHVTSTRLEIVPEQADHPILRGVVDPWAESGAYWVEPTPDSLVLAMARPLMGMTPDSPVIQDKLPCPGAWVRRYTGKYDTSGRVFTTTCGASEDLQNDGVRRMLVNACFWAAGKENAIHSDLPIDFVGPYHPTTFRNGGHRREVQPADLQSWDSPIMSQDKPTRRK